LPNPDLGENLPATSARKLTERLCGIRWPIESCFEEAKGQLGMERQGLRF
jgi:hypothetical protein